MSTFPPGFTVLYQDQQYRPIGLRQHIRQDGTPTQLVDWDSHCADCGAPFLLATTMQFKAPTRRCDPCKKQGVQVTRLDPKPYLTFGKSSIPYSCYAALLGLVEESGMVNTGVWQSACLGSSLVKELRQFRIVVSDLASAGWITINGACVVPSRQLD